MGHTGEQNEEQSSSNTPLMSKLSRSLSMAFEQNSDDEVATKDRAYSATVADDVQDDVQTESTVDSKGAQKQTVQQANGAPSTKDDHLVNSGSITEAMGMGATQVEKE